MRNMMLLWMILLPNCKSPIIRDTEMCDISFLRDRCRCRLVDLNSLEVKSEAQNYELTYCEGFAGFKLEDIAEEIKPKTKAKIRHCEAQD